MLINFNPCQYSYPSLRVAYIDEREETVNGRSEKFYYSVLVKGGDKLDEVLYILHHYMIWCIIFARLGL